VQGVDGIAPLRLTLFGGEYLALELDRKRRHLRPVELLGELAPVIPNGFRDFDQEYAVVPLTQTVQGGTATFRLALARLDEAQVTPRPRAVWGTIIAQDNNETDLVPAGDERVAFQFLTADFEPGRPLPVVELKLEKWPQAGVRARVDLRFLNPTTYPQTLTVDFLNLQRDVESTYREFPGVRLRAMGRDASNGGGWDVLVVATYDAQVDWPVTIEPVSPSTARGDHRYDAGRSEHLFHFDSRPAPEEIRFRIKGVDLAKSKGIEIDLPSISLQSR
jgi:hypothetical protein